MADKTFKYSDHASHTSDPGGMTWVRNNSQTNLTVTDEGHVLPSKTCGGMSSVDKTTQGLVDSGSIVLCPAPATDRGKPREKEAKKPDVKISVGDTPEEKSD